MSNVQYQQLTRSWIKLKFDRNINKAGSIITFHTTFGQGLETSDSLSSRAVLQQLMIHNKPIPKAENISLENCDSYKSPVPGQRNASSYSKPQSTESADCAKEYQKGAAVHWERAAVPVQGHAQSGLGSRPLPVQTAEARSGQGGGLVAERAQAAMDGNFRRRYLSARLSGPGSCHVLSQKKARQHVSVYYDSHFLCFYSIVRQVQRLLKRT